MPLTSSPAGQLKLSFDAIFYYVRNMEESTAFYRDVLGLPVASRDYVTRFDLDGVLFELVPCPPGSAVPGGGNARLCFGVSNLEETLKELCARGVEPSPVKHEKGGSIAFFHDPDGNELCLWQYEPAKGPRELVESAQIPHHA